ncbi:hypothetical protein SERLA73DRAFT_129809 [Serpula lacrymans var. lacrymans S7.3]|uniref:RING-type domain-containing protein n=2 Tax=Serpula lacrymans var. lacrymans TaxID=341189 RepID=F8PJS2_SERL3|nr:hypothetical protein SERLA73DRAFT_129809 [Serpula lacrymans var. lacrymans S7.3]
MHVEYAAVHRDDSDDDDDESEMEEPPDGWEDEYGKIEFPDEEGEETDDDLSWEEYDECDIEREDELHDPLAISLDSQESEPLNSDAISSHSGNVKQSSQDSSLASYDCPLCLDTTKALSVTRCGHIFCTSCIQRVFRTKRLCPVCRQSGSLKQLRKIYPTFA